MALASEPSSSGEPPAVGNIGVGRTGLAGGRFVVIDGLVHTYCSAPGDRDVMIGQAGTGAVLGHALLGALCRGRANKRGNLGLRRFRQEANQNLSAEKASGSSK